MTLEKPIILLFKLIADLGDKTGAAPATKFEGCWEHQVNDKWWLALNAHTHDVKCSHGSEVPPFHCYIEYNGWPAGIVNPYGGEIVAHENANEDLLIAALEAALERA